MASSKKEMEAAPPVIVGEFDPEGNVYPAVISPEELKDLQAARPELSEARPELSEFHNAFLEILASGQDRSGTEGEAAAVAVANSFQTTQGTDDSEGDFPVELFPGGDGELYDMGRLLLIAQPTQKSMPQAVMPTQPEMPARFIGAWESGIRRMTPGIGDAMDSGINHPDSGSPEKPIFTATGNEPSLSVVGVEYPAIINVPFDSLIITRRINHLRAVGTREIPPKAPFEVLLEDHFELWLLLEVFDCNQQCFRTFSLRDAMVKYRDRFLFSFRETIFERAAQKVSSLCNDHNKNF